MKMVQRCRRRGGTDGEMETATDVLQLSSVPEYSQMTQQKYARRVFEPPVIQTILGKFLLSSVVFG